MVTRDWIESEPGPSSKYPAHLAPTLFYGSKREPLVIKQEDGGFEAMGGKLPSRETTVDDVARLVGGDRTVDVIGELRHCWKVDLTDRKTSQHNSQHRGHSINGQSTYAPGMIPRNGQIRSTTSSH